MRNADDSTDNAQYAEHEYWQQRYSQPRTAVDVQHFDWYVDYQHGIKQLLAALQLLTPADPVTVLHIGVGTSRLPFDLYNNGYRRQIGVDYSSAAVQQMRALSKQLSVVDEEIQWVAADCSDLSNVVAGDSISLAIDKGTTDGLLTSEQQNDALQRAQSIWREAHRYLQRDGLLLVFSHYSPDDHLQRIEASAKWSNIDTYQLLLSPTALLMNRLRHSVADVNVVAEDSPQFAAAMFDVRRVLEQPAEHRADSDMCWVCVCKK